MKLTTVLSIVAMLVVSTPVFAQFHPPQYYGNHDFGIGGGPIYSRPVMPPSLFVPNFGVENDQSYFVPLTVIVT